MDARPNIVLVHSAWADGSCWTVELPAGHLAMVSHPAEAAALIRTAAEGVRHAND